MATPANSQSAALLAELHDLLQLDRDAVQAYKLAGARLERDALKAAIERFTQEHDRHVEQLSALIESIGAPSLAAPHVSTSPFKLAAEGLGNAGSDIAVLLAFKANERLSRDKYERAARQGYPPEIQLVLACAADEEAAHYVWMQHTIEQLGAGARTPARGTEQLFEVRRAPAAAAADTRGNVAPRAVGNAANATRSSSGKRRDTADRLAAIGLGGVWIAFGIGFLLSLAHPARSRPQRGDASAPPSDGSA